MFCDLYSYQECTRSVYTDKLAMMRVDLTRMAYLKSTIVLVILIFFIYEIQYPRDESIVEHCPQYILSDG